jgi:hypothetical protein
MDLPSRNLKVAVHSNFNALAAYRRIALAIGLVLTMCSSGPGLLAQQGPPGFTVNGIAPSAMAQIQALLDEKASRTPVQQKIDSQLLYAEKMALSQPLAAGVTSLELDIPRTADNRAIIDIRVPVTDAVLDQLRGLGAEIVEVSAAYKTVIVQVDVTQLEAIAAIPEVIFVGPKAEATTLRFGVASAGPALDRSQPTTGRTFHTRLNRGAVIASVLRALSDGGVMTNTGAVNSEGDKTHNADVARTTYGATGAGVKVGVLSDGVTHLSTSQATGDLGTVTVLSGQAGSGDEGTAMLEIIHDLAPNAQLYFATGFTSLTSFAQNIRDLRTAGCDIIVDDVSYLVESPFQDGQAASVTSTYNSGVLAQAVKDVVATGALYFSSAGNSGNLDAGTSGTWEGDFVNGGSITFPETGNIHSFGALTYNIVTASTSHGVSLSWSDPLGGSSNDYDLFRLNSTGTIVLGSSTNLQNGGQDPFEAIAGASAGDRIVIVKFSGAGRFLHLDTNRGRLSIATQGSTHGHADTTMANSFSVSATPAAAAFGPPTPNGPYPNSFNAGDKVEYFSSDGPRRIFFNADGTAITPGNVSSNGGQLLIKPDLTAADGVSVSGAGGFPSPFYGTSAAAPHAAAIAALIKSAHAPLTSTQVRTALLYSAIDIQAAGIDRDSGWGIVMADRAVASVVGSVALTSIRTSDFDGDGRRDLAVFRPSNGTWYIRYSSLGYNGANTYQWGLPGDIPISGDFDGDGKTDLTVFRPSNGTWYIRYSSLGYNGANTYQWGLPGDIPISGDFDGDGKTDLTVFRPSNGTWYILYSSLGYSAANSFQWGLPGDVPVSGDFDGDGKAELTVWRPSDGTWYIRYSSLGYSAANTYQWGLPGDIPAVGDFDGDGKSELTVWRPSDGTWYIRYSSLGYSAANSFQWGLPGDVPVTGDFDGDGKSELTVWRPSDGTWYIRYSSLGYNAANTFQWGLPGDAPVK